MEERLIRDICKFLKARSGSRGENFQVAAQLLETTLTPLTEPETTPLQPMLPGLYGLGELLMADLTKPPKKEKFDSYMKTLQEKGFFKRVTDNPIGLWTTTNRNHRSFVP